eukprot:gene29930-36145_t
MLASKSLPDFPIERIPAEKFEYATVLQTGFNLPFVVTGSTEEFGIKIPKDKADLVSIAELVGRDKPVRIIEVGKQRELLGYKLGEYADFLRNRMSRDETNTDSSKEDTRVLNMISLEFSGTRLASHVSSPHFVNLIDWVDNRRARNDYPRVQKYCLAGMAGSYTDFHIDFGGTSVWYHIHTGRKGSTFLGDLVWDNSNSDCDNDTDYPKTYTGCTTFTLSANETLFIPSGWIHAVYTPEDSIVFGGNFLHVYSVFRQLQCYHIETSTKIDKAYLFPLYKEINWYFLTEVYQPAKALYDVADSINCAEVPPSGQEDTENITIMMARHLQQPSILLQLPILIKMNELWLKEVGKARDKEFTNTVYGSSLEGRAGYPEGLIEDWWRLLHKIAEYSVRASDVSTSSSSSSSLTVEELNAHIKKIRNASTLDLLSADLQDQTLPGFARDLERIMRGVAVSAVGNSVNEGATSSDQGLTAHEDSAPTELDIVATRAQTTMRDEIDALFDIDDDDDDDDDEIPPPPPPYPESPSSPSLDKTRRKASELLQELVRNEVMSDDESEGGDQGSSAAGGSVNDDGDGDVLDEDAFEDDDFVVRSGKESKKRAHSKMTKVVGAAAVGKQNAGGGGGFGNVKKKTLSIRDMIMKKCAAKGKK